MMVVPTAGLVSGQVVMPSCQRPVCRKRTPGRAPARYAVIYSLRPLHRAWEYKVDRVINQFCLTINSLRWPREGCSRKRGRRYEHSYYLKAGGGGTEPAVRC